MEVFDSVENCSITTKPHGAGNTGRLLTHWTLETSELADKDIPYAGPVVTRVEAMAAGLTRYFTGEPCPQGHIAEKHVSNSGCAKCTGIRAKRYRKANSERTNEVRREHYAKNKDRFHEQKRQWRAENPEGDRAYSLAYREKNRTLLREREAKRRAEQPERIAASWKGYYNRNKAALQERSRVYYAGHREEAASYAAARHAANPEPGRERSRSYAAANKEKVAATRAAYRVANKEKESATNRAWRAANKERIRLRNAARRDDPEELAKFRRWGTNWRLANLDRSRSYTRNRTARKAAAEGSHTAQDIRDLFRLQRGKCAYCRSSLKDGYHVDHIQPLSKGGGNGRDNLQLTCASCNVRKGDRDPIVFAQRTGRLL